MIFLLMSGLQSQAEGWNPKWGKSVGQCQTKNPKGMVWLVKQWHLSPKAETKDIAASQKLPQAPNQTAIYEQLAEWISGGRIQVVFAEGCEGEIKQNFKPAYNGWGMESLKAEIEKPEYTQIVTHIPLKIEARFNDKISTWCGDSNQLVERHSLAFSDVRGLLGYQTRLKQFENQSEKVKPYLESFIKINHLPKSTKVVDALKIIKTKLNAKVTEIKEIFKSRNETFVQVIQRHAGVESAVVIGGLHAEDLKARLEKAQYDCEVIEPTGYAPEDEKLFQDLEKMI